MRTFDFIIFILQIFFDSLQFIQQIRCRCCRMFIDIRCCANAILNTESSSIQKNHNQLLNSIKRTMNTYESTLFASLISLRWSTMGSIPFVNNDCSIIIISKTNKRIKTSHRAATLADVIHVFHGSLNRKRNYCLIDVEKVTVDESKLTSTA